MFCQASVRQRHCAYPAPADTTLPSPSDIPGHTRFRLLNNVTGLFTKEGPHD